MQLCTGRRRANIAFLGARLLLQTFVTANDTTAEPLGLPAVESLLQQCLEQDANHAGALWCLAAVRWLQGNTAGLAAQTSRMKLPDAADPRFHYLAGLAHLLGDDPAAALQACQRVLDRAAAEQTARNGEANGTLDLGLEARYLAALAQIRLGDRPAAIESLVPVSRAPASPTTAEAQAQLGSVQFAETRYEDAIRSWQALDAKKRQEWALAEPLAQTMFVSALEDLLAARYEPSAEKFRQAGRLGCRDRRLGPLLLLALFKAGQQAVYGPETARVGST
jgi:hypothetical protein